MTKLKVAIVHDFLQSFGGAERVTLALSEMYPEAPIYTLTYNKKLDKWFGNKNILTSYLQKWSFIPSRFFIGLYPKAVESFDFSNFDVVISSSNSFVKNIITKPETIHLSYIHSPMRSLWDSAHTQLSRQAHRTPLGRAFGLTELIASNILHHLRVWDRLGASRVDQFIANSKYVAERIKKFYRRESLVIYPPVDTDKIKVSPASGEHFIMIARLSRYKNVDLVVQACNELKVPLVVIGTGEMEAKLKQMAGPTVKITGWIDDEEKIKYIQGSRALIFPVEEDFGIVPVEVMSAGKPVLAYGKGGLLETVINGKTGLFFPELTVGNIKQTIQDFISREGEFNPETISQHAQQFSKVRFQTEIKQLVDKLWSAHHDGIPPLSS